MLALVRHWQVATALDGYSPNEEGKEADMTEYDTTPGLPVPTPLPEEPVTPPAEEPAQADWGDVFKSVDELAAEITRWARSMADNPENRRRARELQARLEGLGRQIGDGVESAAKSEFAKEVSSVAVAAGDAAIDTARRVGDQVLPRVADAMHSAADNIRRNREEREQRREAEPAAAATSGMPDDYGS